MAEVVETARLRPGHCVLSGETQGPFIDTGKNVPRYGRVYISLKWLEQPLREIDYLTPDKAEDLVERNEELESEVSRLREIESDHQTLIENIQQYVPAPEPEVKEVTVTKYRKPSDEEIEDWIEKFGGNHPAVRHARPPEKGSYEEWSRLYGDKGPQPQVQTAETLEDEVEETEEPEEVDNGPDRVVKVHDQNVDLDEVLAENVGDVIAFAEGKGEEFEEALVRREHFLAEKNDRDPRKGVLAPLGYWDDEDDEPLYPADEEETTEPEDAPESDEEEETLSFEDKEETEEEDEA